MAKKEKEAPEVGEQEAENHAEPRVYELGFHIDGDLSLEEAKKAYAGMRSKIESAGTLVAEGEPQKIQLAYTVSRTETTGRRDFNSSYFAWIVYEANGEGHTVVVSEAGKEKRIFRFIDVRTTKEAAEHSVQMHEIMARVAQERSEQKSDEVSDSEIDAALKEVA